MGPFRNNYGIGSSPVVFGETVFVVCEQYKYSFLVAVNKRTGKVRWRAERPTMDVSYVTPVIYSDRSEVVILGSASLDASTRKQERFAGPCHCRADCRYRCLC